MEPTRIRSDRREGSADPSTSLGVNCCTKISAPMRPRSLLLALLCAALIPLSAQALALVSPASGTRLRGGGLATLEWKADALPRDTEEWEAFLSVNGGGYYAYRITPHLDTDLRRFVFIVPNVEARDATILIRTGNEIEETVHELPGRFSIARDERAAAIPVRHLATRRGESARPGDPAVLDWVDGARDGSGITIATATPVSHPTLRRFDPIDEQSAAMLAPDHIAASMSFVAILRQSTIARPPARFAAVPQPSDILLLCRRLNV